MRWLPYFILAYVFLGLQIGMGDYLAFQGAVPNLVLLAVIFVATHAQRDSALLGAFSLGLLQDLLSPHSPGLYALSYGFVGMACVGTSQVLYRESPSMHLMLAFVGGLITGFIVLLHGWIRGPSVSMWTMLLSIAYTTALSPIVLGLLSRVRRIFAFQGSWRVKTW